MDIIDVRFDSGLNIEVPDNFIFIKMNQEKIQARSIQEGMEIFPFGKVVKVEKDIVPTALKLEQIKIKMNDQEKFIKRMKVMLIVLPIIFTAVVLVIRKLIGLE